MPDHADEFLIPPAPRKPGGRSGLAVGLGFLALAAWLYFASPPATIPLTPMIVVSKDLLVPGARRHPIGDPPWAMIGGYKHGCNDCHRLFDSPPVLERALFQHASIRLNHGLNNRCLNCHDRANRDRLQLRDGTLVGFDQVPLLCAQCHGTVYRDWQRGSHGKTMGAWEVSTGLQHRLTCNDCHDPHSPAYPPMAPLPGPHTLRMTDQSFHGHPPPGPLQQLMSEPRSPHP